MLFQMLLDDGWILWDAEDWCYELRKDYFMFEILEYIAI